MHWIGLLLAIVAIVIGVAMVRPALKARSNEKATWYVLALFAWLPVWIVTRLLWSLFTPHSADGYPFLWFWFPFIVAGVLAVASLLPKLSFIKAVGYICAWLLLVSALEIDGFGHHMPWADKSSATSSEQPAKAACRGQIDGLRELRTKIEKVSDEGGAISDVDTTKMDDYRSNLARRECGRFKDIASPLTDGTVTPNRVDADTIMVVADGYDGDGLLYELQCGDSDQADAKIATYEPDKLRCDYMGDKIGPIKLNVTDDYGQTRQFIEKMAVAAPAASAAPAARCTDGFTVSLPDRGSSGRLNASGARSRGSQSAEAFQDQILEQAAVDPLTLFAYYQASPLGDTDSLPNARVLVEGGVIKNGVCYSDRGIDAYDTWANLFENADLSHKDVITYRGFNTGVSGDVVTHSPGVSGSDLEGVDISYRDDDGNVTKRHSALYRCTQPTTPKAPPSTQPGKTDNTPVAPAPRPASAPPVAVPPRPAPAPRPAAPSPVPSPPGKVAPRSPVQPSSPSETTRGVDAPPPVAAPSPPVPSPPGKVAPRSPVQPSSPSETTRGVDPPSAPAPQQPAAPQAPVAPAQPAPAPVPAPQQTLPANPPEVSRPVPPPPAATSYPTGDPCANGC